MDHRQLHPRSFNLALVLGCMAALEMLACGNTQQRLPTTGGAGGGSGGTSGNTSGTGGVSSGGTGGSGSGGSTTSGGTTGSGGDASGGVAGGGAGGTSASGGAGGDGNGGAESGGAGGGAGGIASGGTTGSGGTTAASVSCASNDNCSGDTPLCEATLKVCAQCLTTGDCPAGGHCLGSRCVTHTACANSRDCGTDEVCDPSGAICVQCAQGTDCANGQACVLNRCVSAATCSSSDECSGKVCDTDRKLCVECLSDTECASGTQHCAQNVCRTTCTSDKQCTPQGMLCDTATSVCVQCKVLTDCPASSYCEAGTCKPDICDSTQSTCTNNGVAACNPAGNGWATPTSCGGKACTVSGLMASCGGTPPPDGGTPPADGAGAPADSGPPSDDAPGTCTTATVNPCASIPQFSGPQTVDGTDTEFCGIPSFVFGVANAQVNNNYNSIPDSQFEIVTARLAWSSAGLHAFFDVADSSVETVNMKDPAQAIDKTYLGDSIELFITSSDTVTGLTGTDSNSLHVIVPANGPAVAVKSTNNGGISAAHTALPAAQYSQMVTTTGYAIELLLPWPGSAPSAGTRVRFDLALNSADTICNGVDDMRDAQLLYYLGTAGGATTCPGAADAWCDDRTWCSTALQQ